MPGKRRPMRKMSEVLRLGAQDRSTRRIAASGRSALWLLANTAPCAGSRAVIALLWHVCAEIGPQFGRLLDTTVRVEYERALGLAESAVDHLNAYSWAGAVRSSSTTHRWVSRAFHVFTRALFVIDNQRVEGSKA